jgi:hypothetical protein
MITQHGYGIWQAEKNLVFFGEVRANCLGRILCTVHTTSFQSITSTVDLMDNAVRCPRAPQLTAALSSERPARRSDKALDRGRPGPSQARRATAVLPRADGLGCFTVRRQSGWMSYCLILECSRAGRALPHQNAPGATSVCQSITRVPPPHVT